MHANTFYHTRVAMSIKTLLYLMNSRALDNTIHMYCSCRGLYMCNTHSEQCSHTKSQYVITYLHIYFSTELLYKGAYRSYYKHSTEC